MCVLCVVFRDTRSASTVLFYLGDENYNKLRVGRSRCLLLAFALGGLRGERPPACIIVEHDGTRSSSLQVLKAL